MATKKKTESAELLIVPEIETETAVLSIVGDSPLIMHKWSDKAKDMIKTSQDPTQPKTKKHEPRDPVADFIDSMYWLSGEPKEKTMEAFDEAVANGATFGFPSTAIKEAAVSAGYRAGLTKNKVVMYGAFHIDAEYVQIDGIPTMREDMVKIGMGVADIRYRGEFKEWKATFAVRYNTGVISLEQLANLINFGGFACGIGEWRAEKGGRNGAFHIA